MGETWETCGSAFGEQGRWVLGRLVVRNNLHWESEKISRQKGHQWQGLENLNIKNTLVRMCQGEDEWEDLKD